MPWVVFVDVRCDGVACCGVYGCYGCLTLVSCLGCFGDWVVLLCWAVGGDCGCFVLLFIMFV